MYSGSKDLLGRGGSYNETAPFAARRDPAMTDDDGRLEAIARQSKQRS